MFPAQAGPEGMKKINSIPRKYFHFLFVENLQQILSSRAVGQTAFNCLYLPKKSVEYSRADVISMPAQLQAKEQRQQEDEVLGILYDLQ